MNNSQYLAIGCKDPSDIVRSKFNIYAIDANGEIVDIFSGSLDFTNNTVSNEQSIVMHKMLHPDGN
uniref:AhpC-TSA domain-containing protein n=1 Tax=Meloidogyne hapla TaxID=6305 RepID=A0A1I8BAU6_MELHA